MIFPGWADFTEYILATAQSREVRDKALTPLKKKKASFPVMSPVSSITTNLHILAVDFKFSFAVSLKSSVAILFPHWSEACWQVCNQRTWILPRIRSD